MTSEWNRKQNIAIVVFLFTFLQTWAEKLGLEWTHHVVLNKDSSFHLYWTPTENEILFKIEVSLCVQRCILISHYSFNHIVLGSNSRLRCCRVLSKWWDEGI